MLLDGEIRSQQVSIRSELAEELPPVRANRAQLQQVVVNLIMNAVEAMSTVANHARSLRVKTEMQESDYLLITVEDSGTGIDAENINRIFDAFYTTKSYGTGMGLSICRSIVDDVGLDFWAETRAGHRAAAVVAAASILRILMLGAPFSGDRQRRRRLWSAAA